MPPKILIRDAQVVLPDEIARTHVLIQDGKIVAIDAARDQSADEIIEASGFVLLPGIIDSHVHFREPGLTHKEDIESGSVACAAGGITTFIEMPNTIPPATCSKNLAWKYERAAKVSRVNFGFYIAATESNLSELKQATHAPGIKIFIGSSTGDLLVDSQEALEEIFAKTSLPICAHCEDETTVRANRVALGNKLTVHDHARIRDRRAAVVATQRAIELAIRHQHRFHVLHVSTADEIPLIAQAKPWVTGEVCPHHLFFNVEDFDRLGSLVQMNPALKTKSDNEALWKGLLDKQLQAVVTDHAPHTLEEKKQDYPKSPSGLPAVENSLALMLNEVDRGTCSLLQIASWMSDAPARIWGLVGKGRIALGYDADLVLVDMKLEKTIRNEKQWTRSRWSPWAGSTLRGWPVRTIVGGRTVYQEGRVSEAERGRSVLCDHDRGGYWSTPDGIGI